MAISDQNRHVYAQSLLDLARAKPLEAVEAATMLISALSPGEADIASIANRAAAIACRYTDNIAESIDYGRNAVAAATSSGSPDLLGQALLSLSGSYALAGANDLALRALDDATEVSVGHLAAEVDFQRGAVHQRLGEVDEARACYSRALPVFEIHGDKESVAMTLNNRAMIELDSGGLDAARRDLEEARRIDLALGHVVDAAYADHNLGVIAGYQGDIPTALGLFDDSEAQLAELVVEVAEVQVSRCEVLMSAGLFREALALATRIVGELRDAGLAEDESEAKLAAAEASFLAGKVEEAARWANDAGRDFESQGRRKWAHRCRLVELQSRYELEGGNPSLMESSRKTAESLESLGQRLAASRARLLLGLVAKDLGKNDIAITQLGAVAGMSDGPIATRLQSALARTLVKLMGDDRRGADAAARAGLAELSRHQAMLGATDIRLGVERHGRQLAQLGLRLALESRSPRRVFRWMERIHGNGLVHRPVLPPEDEFLSSRLAEMRQLSSRFRHRSDPSLPEQSFRERQLQSQVRDRIRTLRAEHSDEDSVEPASVAAALDDRTLVEMASLDGRLWVTVIEGQRFRVRPIGMESHVISELNSLRFAMRRLARGRGSVSTAKAIAARLDRMLFADLGLGEGPLVIVPTARLHVVPWNALPTLAARPFVVSPSAKLWLRSSSATSTLPGGALLAAGPDLAHADDEVAEIARLYEGSLALSSSESTVVRIRQGMSGTSVAHIACHAQFNMENPMFSALRLADGDLYAYDLERLEHPPGLVVLSACDSGFSESHAGEELMGLSSALLGLGTRCIVASLGLVPDSSATRDLMTAFHKAVLAGSKPSEALYRASRGLGESAAEFVAANSFICIGAD